MRLKSVIHVINNLTNMSQEAIITIFCCLDIEGDIPYQLLYLFSTFYYE